MAANGPFLPTKYSIDFFTASAVTGSPSLNLAFWRKVKVASLLSAEICQAVARPGANLPSAWVRIKGS